MLHLRFDNIDTLHSIHSSAIINYVSHQTEQTQNELYAHIRQILEGLPENRPIGDYDWLCRFILADVDVVEYWATYKRDYLTFGLFLNLYENKFATIDKSVSYDESYNAYTLLTAMNIKVCPYCDDEYFDIIHPEQGLRRTCEFDHFYPKTIYPALAMCFYNLIPSGKGCNQVMNRYEIEANPYHRDIESWSFFESNVPIGANLDTLDINQFTITLHTSGKMVRNNAVLAIEERYNHRNEVIRDLLYAIRDFSDVNIKELRRMGVSENWINNRKEKELGHPYPTNRGKIIHQKLRHDLAGV